MKNYVEVGFLIKSFGTQGHIKANFKDFYLEDVNKAKAVFINLDGDFIPYFIESNNLEQFFKLKLEGVDNKEVASTFSAKKAYLRLKDVISIEPQLNTDTWIGYSIINESTNKSIGKILEIIQLPKQEVAKIDAKGLEKLIPLHEKIILDVDDDARTITMILAEGILDL